MNITTLLAISAATTLGFNTLAMGPSCGSSSSSANMTSVSATSMGGKKDIIDTALAAGSFNTLAAALTQADLVDTLKGDGPFTVFAPTDEAFAKLPSGTVEMLLKPENKDKLISILTYHVVPQKLDAEHVLGSDALVTLNGQRINVDAKDAEVDDASIVKTDILCSNGIIHVIDEVILPESGTVVDVAKSTGTFNTLVAALGAGDLAEALGGEGPFTVFAPTDEAFKKLPSGTVETLLKPENKEMLRGILLYHVVEGRVFSDDAIEAESAHTLQGSEIRITTKGKRVMINDAKVTSADIDASNGVIHVVNEVLLPSND